MPALEDVVRAVAERLPREFIRVVLLSPDRQGRVIEQESRMLKATLENIPSCEVFYVDATANHGPYIASLLLD